MVCTLVKWEFLFDSISRDANPPVKRPQTLMRCYIIDNVEFIDLIYL